MNRLLAILVVGIIVGIPMVMFAGAGQDFHNRFYRDADVDHDTVGDTVADGRNYYDYSLPVGPEFSAYRAGKFRVIIGAASPIVHGFGNDDSAEVVFTSYAGNILMYADTANCAAIPCTASFTLAANDTLYGSRNTVDIRCVDSTADTAFTTEYPFVIEGIYRGY